MSTLQMRINRALHSRRCGVSIFCMLALATLFGLCLPAASVPTTTHLPLTADGKVLLELALSQHKLVQGSPGKVFAEVKITAPALDAAAQQRQPVDMVVVLDRSGSMAADRKLGYAKQAIARVLDGLGPEDRFALVTFDGTARVDAPLGPLSRERRAALQAVVEGLLPGGSTNISAGLQHAQNMLATTKRGRVLLLSDGEANMGLTDPQALAAMVKAFSEQNTVLSAIGVGIGFNEVLLASLADHGMGNYAYLESPAGLDKLLLAELSDSRAVYAQRSELAVKLPTGARLLDAGGYPLSFEQGIARVPTGQLFAGAAKSFFLTLETPADRVGEVSLGELALRYDGPDGASHVVEHNSPLIVAVLPPTREAEALGSIDRGIFRRNWEQNIAPNFQRSLSSWLRKGDRGQAEQAIHRYREGIAAAGPLPPELKKELERRVESESTAMKDVVNEAFSGSADAQSYKQNVTAKKIQLEAIKQMRQVTR